MLHLISPFRSGLLYLTFTFCCFFFIACASKHPAAEIADKSLSPPAISLPIRDLTEEAAQLRALQVSDIAYDLLLDVATSRTIFSGQVKIQFRLVDPKRSDSLRIDFAGGKVLELQVNGLGLQPNYNGQYLQIPISKLIDDPKTSQTILIKFERHYNQDGRGLSTFLDPVDKKTYLSSQFEAFDANQAFPCFDQPDLKATYEMTVEAPEDWQVITATRESRVETTSETVRRWTFPRTPKFSTYIMSLHAGPYKVWQEKIPFRIPLRLFARQSIASNVKPEEWFPITRFGFDFFENYFGVKYPYFKYDQLLVPEFNAGAMENVAAVTFTERFVSRGPKTKRQIRGLSSTILHEMAHMWFGNLVTMKWWGDLWLNESFATYMATVALAKHPSYPETWQSFAASKFSTYQEDQMPTTHPIVARVEDTEEALTAFDGISYGKGAAVLHQLVYKLGEAKFQTGLKNYFQKYRERNTTYEDFLATVGKAAEIDLSKWSKAWLETAGLNQLQATFDCRSPALIVIEQTSASGTQIPRPHVFDISLLNADLKNLKTLTANLPATGRFSFAAQLTKSQERQCPLIVFPNTNDFGYFKISYMVQDLEKIIASMHKVKNPILRQQLLAISWDHVRDAKIKYMSFAAAIEKLLDSETDEILLNQGIRFASEIQTYMWNSTPNEETSHHRERIDKVIWNRLAKTGRNSTERALWTQNLTLLSSPWGITKLKEALDTPDLAIDQDRRWDLILRLSQLGDLEALTRIEAEALRDPSSRGVERKISSSAAFPNWDSKMAWIEHYKAKSSGYSYSQLRSAIGSLFPASQADLRQRFSNEFEMHLQWANRKLEGMEAALITAVAPYECQPESKSILKQILQTNTDLQPVIRKNLTQILSEAERCQKIVGLEAAGSKSNLQ